MREEEETQMKSRFLALLTAMSFFAAIAILVATLVKTSSAFPGKNGRIAFIYSPTGLGNVYSMKDNGTDVQQLTNFGSNPTANSESWSPDGRQLVFDVFPPNAPGQLWLMNADGSDQHQILKDPHYGEYIPSFAPDGKTLVFSRGPATGSKGGGIYRAQTDGTGLTAITISPPDVVDFAPVYSPDGREIAFVSIGRGGVLIAVYLMNADGSDIHQLTPSWIGGDCPNWSPDGEKIAFSSNGCVGDHGVGFVLNEELWVINRNGTGLTRLTHTNGDWHGYLKSPHDTVPSWSPQGNAITFARLSPSLASSAIYIINSDGSGLRQVLTIPGLPPGSAELSVSGRNAGPRQTLMQRLRRIEMGGSDPQWGVAPAQ
jgi:Tol biopolymer transport system component